MMHYLDTSNDSFILLDITYSAEDWVATSLGLENKLLMSYARSVMIQVTSDTIESVRCQSMVIFHSPSPK